MTREEKIAVIYKEVANKELTFGCIIQTECGRTVSIVEQTADERGYIVVSPESLYGDDDVGAYYIGLRVNGLEAAEEIDIAEIIGHPVMIGDVLDWLDKKICLLIDQGKDIKKLLKGSDALNLRLINIWKYKTKALDEQPDYCIDYVINLLDKFGSVI